MGLVTPPDSWNRGQRIVLVIALGLAFQTVARWLLYSEPGGGWFNFAPAGAPLPGFPDTRRFGPGSTTLVTIGFIAGWGVLSLWLLRNSRRDD